MKPMGIVRNVDSLGRIVVPKEIRKEHGWEEGIGVEMLATEDGVFLRTFKEPEKKTAVIETLYDLIESATDKGVLERLHDVLEFIEEK